MNHKKQQKERRKYVRTKNKRTNDIVVREARKYIRIGYHDDFDFTICSRHVLKGHASSLDVSQNGILFTSDTAPKVNSLITMKPNHQTLRQCLKIEKLLHETDGEILGKVVRVQKEQGGNGYQIAAVFLKKGI